MAGYKPDISKIHPNPFGFKSDPKEAAGALEHYLKVMAQFFECVAAASGQVEAAWQRYQDAHDEAGVLRLAFSISHVLGVQGVLEVIDECKQDHELGQFTGFQVLLHLGLIELVESGPHVSQFQWMFRRLKKEPKPTIPVSGTTVRPKDIRRFLTELEGEYNAERGTSNTLVRALTEGLDEGDRAALLNGWAFSEPYKIGERVDLSTLNHLHCRRRYDSYKAKLESATTDADRKHYTAMLRPNPCTSHCRLATGADLADLFPVLVKDHLYHMRNELVHAASPMEIAHSPSKASLKWLKENDMDVPMKVGGSLLAGYFVEGGKMVTYQVTAGVEMVKNILRRCLWNRLQTKPIPAP